MSEVKRKYYNKRQIESMAVAARNEYIVASRGFGKSVGIDAPRLLRNVHAMPGSTGAFLSNTYAKLLQNTLPAVASALDSLGFKRDVHYVIGRKPLKGFAKPLFPPFKYDHVMSWYNGTIVHLLSFDRAMSANSMNLDWVLGFEARYLDYEKTKVEVFPAIRGQSEYFGKCPWHHGRVFTTDMPMDRKGSWIFEKENDMDPELIEYIKQLYAKYSYYKYSVDASPHSQRRQREILKELNKFRSIANYYAEYSAFDNIEILGEQFIADQRRDLPDLIFNVSILNKRLRKVDNGFYSALNRDIHCYEAYNNEYLDSLAYNLDRSRKIDCRSDADLSEAHPLAISLDYNAAINNLIVSQLIDNRHKTVNAFYVKTPRKLPDVVQEFCSYYAHRINRHVTYYYDSTAIWETAQSGNGYAEDVIDILSRNGFIVEEIYLGVPMRQDKKHLMIDNAMKGDQRYPFPSFNLGRCEFLMIAMEQTETSITAKGFGKNKNPEKKPDTPQEPDEYKTHVTDAWDTNYVGCSLYPPGTQNTNQMPTHWG